MALREQAAAVAARLTPLPARIQALMVDLSDYVQPHLTDRKSRREAIQIEAMAIVRESWALSTEVQRLAEVAAGRAGRSIGPHVATERIKNTRDIAADGGVG